MSTIIIAVGAHKSIKILPASAKSISLDDFSDRKEITIYGLDSKCKPFRKEIDVTNKTIQISKMCECCGICGCSESCPEYGHVSDITIHKQIAEDNVVVVKPADSDFTLKNAD